MTGQEKILSTEKFSPEELAEHYASKEVKRRIEEIGISEFIKNYISRGLALSAIGPALKEHLKTFLITRGRSHLVAVEWSNKIYESWIANKPALASELNLSTETIHLKEGNIFSLVQDRSFKELILPLGKISDIDLDLMGIASLEVPKVIKLLQWFSLNAYLLSDTFCITYTCTLRDKTKLTVPSIRSLDFAMNHFLGANLIKIGHRSYKDVNGPPMYTMVYILEKSRKKELLTGNKEIILPPVNGGYLRKISKFHQELSAIAA